VSSDADMAVAGERDAAGEITDAATDLARSDGFDPGPPCSGGCSMFVPAWSANPPVRPPYGSSASRVVFADDTTLIAGVGVLSLFNGSLGVGDGHVLVFDKSGMQLAELGYSASPVASLAVSPDRTRVAVGSNAGGQILIASIAGTEPAKQSSHGITVSALAWSPDGTSLFAGGTESYFDDPPVRRIDVASGAFIQSMPLKAVGIKALIVDAAGASIDAWTQGTSMRGPTQATLRATDLAIQRVSNVAEYVVVRRDPRTGGVFVASATAVMGVPVPGERIVAAAPHPTLPKAVVLQADGTLRLVDLLKRRVEDTIRVIVHPYDVAISTSGDQVVVAGIQPAALSAFSLDAGVRPPAPRDPAACGNGAVDPGEACDHSVGSATCSSIGFAAGTLSCAASCRLNTAQCTGRAPGWTCPASQFNDGVCDCGCGARDPDCGLSGSASACGRSACQNGAMPALTAPWTCTIDACTNLGPAGRCDGERLQVCDATGMHSLYCSSYSGSCKPRLGDPTCVVPKDQPCVVANGSHTTFFSCEGSGMACVYDATPGGLCRPGYDACSVDSAVCLGPDRLRARCVAGQPLVYDCWAMGGSCSSGQCIDLPRGATCDAVAVCADGLVCTDGSCK
jgi:hypothetical protein